jgi:hypothetical protein
VIARPEFLNALNSSRFTIVSFAMSLEDPTSEGRGLRRGLLRSSP